MTSTAWSGARLLERRVTMRRGLRLRDVAFRVYLVAVFGPPAVLLAAQLLEMAGEALGVALPVTDEAAVRRLGAVLSGAGAGALLLWVQTAAWRIPVAFAPADVAWLLASPLPRHELLRPRLVRAFLRGAGAGAGLGAAAGVLVADVLGGLHLAGAAVGAVAGSGLVAVAQAAAWWVVCAAGRARAVLRISAAGGVAVPAALVAGWWWPVLGDVLVWSGPWGWPAAGLLAAAGGDAGTAAVAAALTAAAGVAGVLWALRAAAAPPAEELARRAGAGAGARGAAFLYDFEALLEMRWDALALLRGPPARSRVGRRSGPRRPVRRGCPRGPAALGGRPAVRARPPALASRQARALAHARAGRRLRRLGFRRRRSGGAGERLARCRMAGTRRRRARDAVPHGGWGARLLAVPAGPPCRVRGADDGNRRARPRAAVVALDSGLPRLPRARGGAHRGSAPSTGDAAPPRARLGWRRDRARVVAPHPPHRTMERLTTRAAPHGHSPADGHGEASCAAKIPGLPALLVRRLRWDGSAMHPWRALRSWPAGRSSQDGRLLVLAGLFGPLAYMTLVAVIGLLVSDYNPVYNSMSELGAVDSPYRHIMNVAGFMGLGVTILVFAVGYHLQLRRGRLKLVATGLLCIAGGFMVAVGFFPCDPGCVDVSATGRLHSVTSFPQAIALPAAAMLSAAVFRADGRLGPGWQAFSFWAGLVALGTGPLVAADLGAVGLVQRAGMGLSLLWMIAVSVRLHRLSRDPSVTRPDRVVGDGERRMSPDR